MHYKQNEPFMPWNFKEIQSKEVYKIMLKFNNNWYTG